MVRKHSWQGSTEEQAHLLDYLDRNGNNGWARNPKSEEIMPTLMGDLRRVGLTLDRAKAAMKSIGYDKEDLQELDRWESKRTTGKFGR
jgi:hypothetical protein